MSKQLSRVIKSFNSTGLLFGKINQQFSNSCPATKKLKKFVRTEFKLLKPNILETLPHGTLQYSASILELYAKTLTSDNVLLDSTVKAISSKKAEFTKDIVFQVASSISTFSQDNFTNSMSTLLNDVIEFINKSAFLFDFEDLRILEKKFSRFEVSGLETIKKRLGSKIDFMKAKFSSKEMSNSLFSHFQLTGLAKAAKARLIYSEKENRITIHFSKPNLKLHIFEIPKHTLSLTTSALEFVDKYKNMGLIGLELRGLRDVEMKEDEKIDIWQLLNDSKNNSTRATEPDWKFLFERYGHLDFLQGKHFSRFLNKYLETSILPTRIVEAQTCIQTKDQGIWKDNSMLSILYVWSLRKDISPPHLLLMQDLEETEFSLFLNEILEKNLGDLYTLLKTSSSIETLLNSQRTLGNGCQLCTGEPAICRKSMISHLQDIFLPKGLANCRAKKLLSAIKAGYKDWPHEEGNENPRECLVMTREVTGIELTKAILENLEILQGTKLLQEPDFYTGLQGFVGKEISVYEELRHYYSSFPTLKNSDQLPLLLSIESVLSSFKTIEQEEILKKTKKFREALESDKFEKKWENRKTDRLCQAISELFN